MTRSGMLGAPHVVAASISGSAPRELPPPPAVPAPVQSHARWSGQRRRHAARFALVRVGAISLAAVLLIIAAGFGLYARHWIGLAERSRIGARSEDEMRRELAALEKDGWRMQHSLPWRGRGDIDSVAIAPNGIAFVIETKTMAYDDRHLDRVREQAAWLARRRRRSCPTRGCSCSLRRSGPRRAALGARGARRLGRLVDLDSASSSRAGRRSTGRVIPSREGPRQDAPRRRH